MEPLITALALAIQAGAPFVVQKLIEKGVIEPGVKPFADKVQARATAGQKDQALVQAILTAIEDASGQEGESLAVEYGKKIRLHEIVEPGHENLRNEVIRLVLLASSADPSLVPDSLLDTLRLNETLRADLARFLFSLRRRLNKLPDFHPLFEAAHQQRVETELGKMSFDLSSLARTVDKTREGAAVRVRIVKDDWNAAPYLNYLANLCNLLPLAIIDPKYASPTAGRTITLSDVYTNLEVTFLVKVKPDKRQKRTLPSLEREETRRMTVLEAIGVPEHTRLVLLGDPGGGKSTFANFLAYGLAMNLLDPERKWLERLPEWTLGGLLPVRVILRDWVAWIATQPARQPNAQALWDFIQHDLTEHGLEDSFKPLRDYLLTRSSLVLLDGLDEVPEANERREFLKGVIEDFARAPSTCRIVVTCRPYAYVKRDWKLQGFAVETLAPFSREQIETFVRGWYNAIVHVLAMNPTDAKAKATALIDACELPYLAPLAQSPLLLTLMATLHTSRGKLPDDRADLYEDCVRLLLDYWQESKKVRVGNQTTIERGIIDELGISRDRLERALNQVAFQAHEAQGKLTDRKNDTADISGDDLRKVLVPALGDDWGKAQTAIHYIRTRAGLLLEREPDRFAFPHRTFQEFLAARYLVGTQDYPFNLAQWTFSDRAWWREVYLLAAGHQRANAFGQAVSLINELTKREYVPGQRIQDDDAFAAALAAQAAVEVRLAEHATEPGRYCDTYRKLQKWLVGIIAQGALPLKDRAEVGRILGALGDPREFVVCVIPALVDVPAGEFKMGEGKEQHRVTLKAYRIGKYPVTNAQFRRFVDDGGYTDKHRDCWTNAGWEWRAKEKIEKPPYLEHLDFGIANHPVVAVSWYEAVAYCNWLTKTDSEGRKFRLPTEAEWERAARGTDARDYPWGNDFDQEKANTDESGIGQTSAVGLFPLGESTCHALDMAGNVWEWCSSKANDYPYRVDDGREDMNGTNSRILRGGSWYYVRVSARCAPGTFPISVTSTSVFGLPSPLLPDLGSEFCILNSVFCRGVWGASPPRVFCAAFALSTASHALFATIIPFRRAVSRRVRAV